MIWFSILKASSSVLALFSVGQTLMFDSSAQQSTNSKDHEQISRSEFVRLAFHSSTVAGNTLFIDGGEITLLTQEKDPKPITTTQNKTLTLDLSKSWTTAGVTYGSIDKDPSVPILNYGALWTSPDNASILSFGGVRSSYPYSPRIGNIELWEYSATSGWSGTTSESPASPTLTNSRPAAAASTHGHGIGYTFGGIRGNDNAPWWPLPGLLTYDMSENTWTNESTASIMPYGTVGGSLTYVPGFGTEGVLIAMGGEYTGAKPWMEMATNFAPFTNISIWDVASKSWYWQNATANNNFTDIPPPATMFCSVGSAGPNGTFEIFTYGGHSDTFLLSSKTPSDADRWAQYAFNTVHVLSLPGFVWTRVDPGTVAPRTGHTCNIIGNSQMLSIGGLDPMYKLQDAQGLADNFTQGLGIFDMVNLKWTASYDANAARYDTPTMIQKWYNAHPTKTSIDWSSSGVQALFDQPVHSTASTSNSAPIPSTKVFVPAIVCAIVGAALLAALAMFLYRRSGKRYKEGALPKTESGDTLTHDLRSYLDRLRKPYLAQRQAFLRQNISRPIAISSPKSLGSSRGSSMIQHDISRIQYRPNNSQDAEIVVGFTPETWSSTQYPDHPAFSHAEIHTINSNRSRDHHNVEIPRTAHVSPQSGSHCRATIRTNIPHMNTGLDGRYHNHHQDGHVSPASEWSMTTVSTARFRDDRDVSNHSAFHHSPSSPQARTGHEHRSELDASHGGPIELE